MLLGAVPGVAGKREEGLGNQPYVLGELVATGAGPPVLKDVEGRSPVELLL